MIKNICFCSDGNYVGLLNSAVLSLLETNSNLTIHILKFDDFDTTFIDRLGERYQVNVNYYRFDLELPAKGRFSKAMFGRLYIPTVIDCELVLYLDCDVIVNSDLTGLFNTELNNTLIGAIEDKTDNITRKLKDKYNLNDYFNSGVLLIKNNEVTQAKLNECIELIKVNSYEYPDQDVINIVFKDEILKLHKTYNYFYSGKALDFEPVIIHFALEKPWLPLDSNYYSNLYDKLSYRTRSYGGEVFDPIINNKYYIVKIIKLILKKVKIFDALQLLKWRFK